jgi:frataxin
MNERLFHPQADTMLDRLVEALESADENGMLEVEFQAGILTISLPNRKQFIVNKHAPTQQLWLSSPVSGGLHFPFDEKSNTWRLADGRELTQILSGELKMIGNIEVVF